MSTAALHLPPQQRDRGYDGSKLHADAIGLRLIRHDGRGRAHFSEMVYFENGRAGVDTTLRRAALAGKVDLDGKIRDHHADVLTGKDGQWDQTVALDASSYRSLKHRWMRCRTESIE